MKSYLPLFGIRYFRDRWAEDRRFKFYEGIYRESATHRRFIVIDPYQKQTYYFSQTKDEFDN